MLDLIETIQSEAYDAGIIYGLREARSILGPLALGLDVLIEEKNTPTKIIHSDTDII